MSPTGNSQSGFTLIELLVTLALAGLLLALVPPLLGKGGDRARLAHDRRALLSQLRLARSEAIMADRPVALSFDLTGHRYGIAAKQQPIDPGIDLDLDLPAAEGAAIRFFPDGSASGGSLRLSNQAGAVELQVDWLTGRITALP